MNTNESTKEQRKILSAQVSPEMAARLQQMAGEADRSLSAEIRRAFRSHIERSSRS